MLVQIKGTHLREKNTIVDDIKLIINYSDATILDILFNKGTICFYKN